MATKKKAKVNDGKVKQDFTVLKGQAIPIQTSRGNLYPFNSMDEKGDAFFVRVTVDKKDAGFAAEVKRLKGSVGGAARRFKGKFITGYEPEFVVQECEHPETGEPCVGCWLTKVGSQPESRKEVKEEESSVNEEVVD